MCVSTQGHFHTVLQARSWWWGRDWLTAVEPGVFGPLARSCLGNLSVRCPGGGCPWAAEQRQWVRTVGEQSGWEQGPGGLPGEVPVSGAGLL